MIIFIVERDNSDCKPEPQVFVDGRISLDTVKKEFSKQMEDCGLSKEDIGTCDTFECLWYFSENAEEEGFCGDALIDCDGDRFEWRITKHDTENLNNSDDEDDEQDYDRPSCTAHDYSPANPWDAPGMSIRDFI